MLYKKQALEEIMQELALQSTRESYGHWTETQKSLELPAPVSCLPVTPREAQC
jgi:hypothetical protein